VSDIPAGAPDDAPPYVVDVQVDPPFVDRVAVDALVAVAERVLRQAGQPAGTTLTLVITDDETIRALNRTYRAEDSATDVLSFSATEGDAFVTPDDEAAYLGDVIVSFPTALAQAGARGEPVEDELRLLVAHGCLHLLGYDHATPEEEAAMWALQAEALRGSTAE